jgi:hypothetical protein
MSKEEDPDPPPPLTPWTFWAALVFALLMILAAIAVRWAFPHLPL